MRQNASVSKPNGGLRYQSKRYIHQTFTVFGINRVEPRESNSRPVFGREFLFKEVAMTADNTITRQRLGGRT